MASPALPSGPDVLPSGDQPQEETRGGRGAAKRTSKRAKSVVASERATNFEERITRLEESVVGLHAKWEDVDLSIKGLDDAYGELYGSVQETASGLEGLQRTLLREIDAIKVEVQRVATDVALCKAAVAQGGVTPAPSVAKIDVPRPKMFDGARNGRELDNFLWGLERYFEAAGMTGDAAKLRAAPLYLADTAMVWWRRLSKDVEAGTCPMGSWDDFQREIRKQFYPDNVEDEARGRLRRLAHKGNVRDYVKEFTELILEIPDLPDKEALFAFTDGLQPWAKVELQRRGVKDLATAIATAEGLVEYRKGEKGSKEAAAGGEGLGSHPPQKPNAPTHPRSNDREKGKEDMGPPGGCFICGGPHRASNCPKRSKFSAMVHEACEEPDGKVMHAGSMRRLDSI